MNLEKGLHAPHLLEAVSKGPELVLLPYFPATLIDLIRNATVIAPEKGILAVDGEGYEDLQSYAMLLEEAGRVLGYLREQKVRPGDQIVLQIDDDRLFITAFWGGILGGFVPVPLALPNSFPISEGTEKVAKVCKLLENAFVITDQSVDAYKDLEVKAVFPVREMLNHAPDTVYHTPSPDETAYIQFSSGSTGDPKGVVLTHHNLLVNIYAILRASANAREQALINDLFSIPVRPMDLPFSTCSWLPYSHDMGLIGFHLAPMAAGMLQIKMSTTTFVVNPALNIVLIDKYRVTQIPSPNFGLLWMLYMVKDEVLKDIDLSCVEVLYNGAEPISPTAVRLFINRFSQYGFNPDAMFPVYGMAEAALMVTAPPVGTPSVYHLLDRTTFAQAHVAAVCRPGEPSIEFVDEGHPAMGMEIRIVDNDDRVMKETEVGHIQIKGPNITQGYYRNEAANRDLFCGEWLRTGDLGFLKEGRLTVTGRHKDVIFVNGQNYYSHDIEEELQQIPAVGFKNMAVCGITDHNHGSERIVLFLKTKKSRENLHELLMKINEHVGKKLHIGIDSIVPMVDIPRTSSGKIQRFILRERYERGEFKEIEVRRLDKWVKTKGEEITIPAARRYAQYIDLKGPDAHSMGPELNLLPYFPLNLTALLLNATIFAPQRGVLYVDAAGNETLQPYPLLLDESGRVLAGLRAHGLRAGAHVVMQIEDDRLFLSGFWGCILGGFIPVPLALPNSFPISEGSEKVANVCKLLENAYILTDQPSQAYANLAVTAVLSIQSLTSGDPDTRYHDGAPDDTAYIQFSSGSTGSPKGVILTHRNLLTNIFAILRASANEKEQPIIDEWYGNPPQEREYPVNACSWLPYSHDMGLIGFHLAPMAAGMLQIKMSTTTFVINPALNILLIDKYRITQIPSPNFGLLWMLYMVKDDAIKGVDLSCVEVLYNGAEPISPTAVRLFISRFSQYGFNPRAMFPVYGMAEASLLVTAPPVGMQTIYHVIDREGFSKAHVAVDPKEDDPTIEFVDEGYPAMGMEVRIVDEHDNIVKESMVGHIQIKGPNVTRGYYKHEEANRELFCGSWLRTGDLGFITNGRLTVTGRYKDVIFINGQNYYSHDIEEELQLLPFIGFKNMAICGVTDHQKGSEKIVLFMKSKKPKEELLDLLVKINEHLGKKIKVGIDAIVPMHDIPRTTSGKVQRFVLRERYEAGDFRDREVRRIEGIWSTSNSGYENLTETPVVEEREPQKRMNIRGLVEDLPLAIVEGNAHQFLPRFIKTLPEVLKIASVISPDRGILHVDGDGFEYLQTYSALLHSSECVLGALREHGLRPGDQVILQVEEPRDFLAAFWGIVLGGFIPVPLPIPGGFPISEGMERITKVSKVLDRVCIITDQPAKGYRVLGDIMVLDIRDLLAHAPDTEHHKPQPDDIAYLQFSSGSTGDPKGVILTHKNLIYTIDASAKCTLDVRGRDIRPTIGFGIHILRRKLWGQRRQGIIAKVVDILAKSSLSDAIRRNQIGKDILDTLLIFGGYRISEHTDLKIDDIKIVNWMPYSHDMGLIGFHLAPTLGGMDQIKLEPRTFVQRPALFLRLIDRYRASHVPCPNFGVQWLTSQVDERDIEGIDLSCIKSFVNGSEPISPSVTREFIAKFGKFGFDPRAMYMVYGMAEASLQVSAPPVFSEALFHKVDKDVFVRDQIALPTREHVGSLELTDVGYPVAGMRIRIVDDQDILVHENTVGHIQIQGPHVVQGYFKNPAANKDLFCDGWLRTGDMGFIRGGRLIITGRRKDIIFVNGQNLYAHDIEEHIKRVPGMAFKEFAISGLRHFESDSEKVILFINTPESKAALASLLSRINEALVSSIGIKIDFIVPVSEIPRTPSAKIKRHRLREQFEKGAYQHTVALDDAVQILSGDRDEQGHTLSDMERRIIEIWKDILGVDTISKFDNFFDLGGNSLRATKLVSRIREEFGLEIPLRTIFECQTIETLAQGIESMIAAVPAALPPIKPLAPQPYYEASHAQKRLWLLDKVVPDSPFYNIPGAVLLDNITLDLDVLKRALQAVVDRHETLRTVFKTEADEPVQVIADTAAIDLPIIDLSGRKGKDIALTEIIEAEKRKPFNLATGPLFRVSVVRLDAQQHAFIIIMHHIIADGWSMAILVQEAVGNYLAFLEGKPSPFPALQVQYKDFAAWQNIILESQEIKRQEAYWLENLQGRLPVLNLPTDRPRPTVQTQNGATLRMHIGKDFATKLREIARREDVTPFMLTLALFKVMLHKLTGQEDIIIGAPIAGRNVRQIEPLIGFFVNVLPLRTDLSSDPLFSELLAQIRQTALAAYANQDYPFDRLVEALNPVRDLSRTPVFDITFEFREATANPFAGLSGQFAIREITGDDPHAKFDLSVTGYEEADGLTMKFEYNADLFDARTIERLMAYYQNIMRDALEHPHKRISQIEMLPAEERQRVLVDFNNTDQVFPTDICLHELFASTAQKFPTRPALVFKGNEITYQELNRKTNTIARYLKAQGAKPGDLVGILMDRCPEMIMAQLGVWKVGAAFVPIDYDYPRERIRYMMEDCGAAILLVKKAFLDKVQDLDARVVPMDEEAEIWKAPATAVRRKGNDKSLAYVVYTSGSTGRPKGAQITHRNFMNMVQWHIATFGIEPQDRASNLAGVAFDATEWEIWPYLCSGAAVVSLDKSLGQMLPEDLANWFIANGITRTFVPTKFAEIFMGMSFPRLPLKTMFTGGDRLNFVPKQQTYAVINCYGPTECAVLVTAIDVSAWDNAKGSPPIGKPIANAKIYLLDKNSQPVPVGVIGELCIGGVPVGKGYFGDQEKTDQVFIPNPFGAGSDRLYKTGDLARWLPDGNIDFIGRADFQVEIRGYRVELGEIEAVLSSHPAVKECVVLDKADAEGQVRLVAFYVAEYPIEEEDCKAFLREQLPSYMVPTRFIPLDMFPMTPNGKLDRTALSNMVDLSAGGVVEYIAPRTPIETALADFWQSVLGVVQVGAYDNFFDLGGNSLRATKIVSWARETYGIELPLKAVFEHQTLEALAGEIEYMTASGLKTLLPPIKPVGMRDAYAVSHAQKRLWYIDKVVPNSPHYNIPGAVLIQDAALDIGLLRRAFQAVVERHESLRTTIRTVDELPVQVIAPELILDMPVIDLAAAPDQDSLLREIIEREKLTPFDLEQGPLFRIKLATLSEHRQALLITMHHIVSDGWSMGILVKEALANYLAFSQGEPSPFAPLAIQYKDFAHWQNEILAGEEIKRQEAYWVERLAGELPVLALLTDHPRPAVQSQNGAMVRVQIAPELTERMRALARQEGVTPFMLTLALFEVLLAKLTGQEDIIVGTPIAGRNNAQIEGLIGFFVNMLPMRADLSGNPSFTDFLRQVRQTALSAYAHQDYPFDKLVEAVNPPRNLSRSPIFDVVFDFHEISANPLINAKLGGVTLREITGDDLSAKFDLLLTGYEGMDGITLTLGYNTDLFECATAERMLGQYVQLFRNVLDNPATPLSELAIMDAAERERIVKGFNDCMRPYPREKCTHTLFEEQVRLNPEKDALVFGTERMSYAELNARANRIARYLRAHGVGRGTYVALMVQRSFDMLAGCLGILKAGGAYVPIEAEYPRERIDYMLAEIKAPVAIVHAELMEALSGYTGQVMCLERFWEEEAQNIEASDLEPVNTPDDVAYVIYTSGSTGKPKGVMVPHRGIVRLVKNTNYADITADDRFLQIATVAFDAATMEFWGPLTNGGTLYLVSSNDAVNPEALADLLLKHEITIIFITTVMYNQLVDTRPDGISKLKSLLTGGEMHSLAHMRKGFQYVRPGALTHVYGPTENTTYSTYYPVLAMPENMTSVPIGYPLANSTVYILDKYLKPVPIGVPGEIYVGGDGLARGYLNDPEKTARTFIANPIPDIEETVLYKTGDLGVWLPDGAVDILGRMDQQVKIRGHRIELGEIEANMRRHEYIKDCVVVVKDLGSNNKMLLAYYVSTEEIPTDVLRSFLKETLPDYMIPNMYLRLESIPLNKNGKVDKAALPEPKGLRPEMATAYIAPTTEIEEIIAQAWSEVLGVDKVGIYDNFFDLGGDSIISLQVVSRLNQKGFKLQPRDILQYQTISELAAVVVISRGIESEQGPVTGTAPLTPIQHWFFDQRLANANHFNQALLFVSQARIDGEALHKSLQAIIDHHDSLRGRFRAGIQEFMPLGEAVRMVDKSLGSEEELVPEINALQSSLNIGEGPLFAAGLFRMEAHDYLVLACHHLVVDGVSWRILLEDLLKGYFATISGGAIELPKKTTSFKEWAERLNAYAGQGAVLEEESHWKAMLPAVVPALPLDHDLGPNDVASISAVKLEFDELETAHLLKDAHRAYNTEVNDLLATALMLAVSAWTGQADVVFDMEGHGREDVIDGVDISRTVGWFTTLYPVALQAQDHGEIKDQIKHVKERLHRIPHKGFNYGVLTHLCGRDLGIPTEISFNYLGQIISPDVAGSFKIATQDVSGIMDESNLRSNLIDVVCIVVDGHMRVNFVFSQNKHKWATINTLAQTFRTRLLEIITHCLDPANFDITPSDFELVELDQAELDKLTNFE